MMSDCAETRRGNTIRDPQRISFELTPHQAHFCSLVIPRGPSRQILLDNMIAHMIDHIACQKSR